MMRWGGEADVPIDIIQIDGPGRTAELLDIRTELADWTSIKAFAMHVVKMTF